jgi:hypothetical protein
MLGNGCWGDNPILASICAARDVQNEPGSFLPCEIVTSPFGYVILFGVEVIILTGNFK